MITPYFRFRFSVPALLLASILSSCGEKSQPTDLEAGGGSPRKYLNPDDAAALYGSIPADQPAPSESALDLNQSLTVAFSPVVSAEVLPSVDWTSAGVGGMRNNGVGTVTLSGISGTVTKATLYWHGPTNSSVATTATGKVDGVPVTGSSLGLADDNNWGYANSEAWKADVTAIVAAKGNGAYQLTDFGSSNPNTNGASIVVFYDDGNSANNRRVVVFDGNESNVASAFDGAGWNVTLSGISLQGGTPFLQLHVADGQTFAEGTLQLNGNTISGVVFNGASVPSANNGPSNNGSLWDIATHDVASSLVAGDNTLTYSGGSDALGLIVAIVDVPANMAPVITPAQTTYHVRAGTPLTFNVNATDSNAGDMVTLQGQLPAGATLTNAGPGNPVNATLNWTPGAGAGQSYSSTLVFTATDQHGAAAQPQSVTVNVEVGTIEVLVLHNGQPVPNMLVGVVNSQTGPYRADGSRTLQVTNNAGLATVSALAVPGNYCVWTKPFRRIEDGTGNFSSLVPPPTQNGEDFEPLAANNFVPAITGDNGVTQQFTKQGFIDNCIHTPPIALANNQLVTIDLSSLPAPSTMRVTFTDLNGDPVDVAAWNVIDMSDVTFPWTGPGYQANVGVKRGLLMTGAPFINGSNTIYGNTPNIDVVVESGIKTVEGQGELTFTLRTNTGTGTESDPNQLGTFQAEPLLCVLNKTLDPLGDGNGKFEFAGYIKDGFKATYGVPLLLRNEISIFYSQLGTSGTGGGKLHMMFTVNGVDLNLMVDYSWSGTTGTVTHQSGAAYDAGVRALGFFAPIAGGARISWNVLNLPADLSAVRYKLQTAGDVFPSARNQGGWQSIPLPTVCTGGQGNDDQWWID